MQEENATENKQESAEPVESTEGLGLRESLEAAIEQIEAPKDAPEKQEAPAKQEPEKPAEPALAAPGEWTAEEKADFAQLSRKQQEAALRLHKSRAQRLNDIKTAAAEYNHLKELANDVNPYLQSMGVKDSPTVAIQKAVKLWKELKESDPKQAAAAYLRSRGIEPPAELIETGKQGAAELPAEVTARLQAVDALIMEQQQQKLASARQNLSSAWTNFEAQKNAAGTAKYPDLNESESGLALASNIGTLVSGNSDLSRQFLANLQARIPNLTVDRVLEEAYRFYGGKVDDSPAATKSQSTQQHLIQSKRAAAPVPGRAPSSSRSEPVKRFKTYREAAEAALRQLHNE